LIIPDLLCVELISLKISASEEYVNLYNNLHLQYDDDDTGLIEGFSCVEVRKLSLSLLPEPPFISDNFLKKNRRRNKGNKKTSML
jgi:hypothetical protein